MKLPNRGAMMYTVDTRPPEPMLLSEYQSSRGIVHGQDYIFIQPKLNGWRCTVNTATGQMYSRYGNQITLPHISRDVMTRPGRLPLWLDGELYIRGGTDATAHSGITRQDEAIKFYCFDAITDGLFSERLDVINRLPETEPVRIVQTYKITPDEIFYFYNQYLNMGLEGAVIRLDREYQHGRSGNIFKLKP